MIKEKVFLVNMEYIEHYTAVNFKILIAAIDKEEAKKVALEYYKNTEEHFEAALWQEEFNKDYELTEEAVTIRDIEEFDDIIMNEPEIYYIIPLGIGEKHVNGVGNWSDILTSLVAEREGVNQFRRLYITFPIVNDNVDGLTIYYKSELENKQYINSGGAYCGRDAK